MKRIQIALVSLFLGSSGNLRACLWDRDTLAQEAVGIPEVSRIITGRFERNPPRFYEMRLQRIEGIYGAAPPPEKLALCDDAGVACDRLHRGDEAIAWMEKKNQLLEALPDSPEKREHVYRYHANLGTFVIHRWLRAGASRDRIDEAEKARALIATAIKINPDAHFGREKYQLMAIEWLIELDDLAKDPDRWDRDPRCFINLHPYLISGPGSRPSREIEDAVEGITGLVSLGDAWESIDIFYGLSTVLQNEERSTTAYLADLRIEELRKAGKRSCFPGPNNGDPPRQNMSTQKKSTAAFFRKARAEADAWQTVRHRFMETEFAAGKHPDTHPDFWEGFTYFGKAPALPTALAQQTKRWIGAIGLIFLILVSPLLLTLPIIRLKKRFPDSPAMQAAIVFGSVTLTVVVWIGAIGAFAFFFYRF